MNQPTSTPGTPPRIAVLYYEDVEGERLLDYVDSLVHTGAHADCVSPDGMPDLPDRLAEYDGIVLTGGIDVAPAVYGETPHRTVRGFDRRRDDFELATLRAALKRDLPVLGVCRGHQLLNVAFGGKLLQHIDDNSHRWQRVTLESSWHEVRFAPDSMLARVLRTDRLNVNSRHHQGVTADTLAPGLVVAGTTADGMIEALEAPGYRFVAGVQWHPEREELTEASTPLFRAFVRAAKGEDIP